MAGMAVEHARDHLLQVRGLSVTYLSGDGRMLSALDRLDLRARSGEILGILGESGCGKTTLAMALLRTLPTHSRCEGEILLGGSNLLDLQESDLCAVRGKEISLIPQDPALSLNPVMRVGTQIAEVLRAHFSSSRKARRTCVYELLHEVGFDQPRTTYDAYPHQLSGGQRQRVAIAQALACRPALLIADEPTSKLDASLRTEIMALLSGIRGRHGTTIVVISHDPALLAGFADRVAVMYAGKVVEIGSGSQIFREPLHPYTRALVSLANASRIGEGGRVDRFPTIPGDLPNPCSSAVGCRFEPRCSERLNLCRYNNPREVSPEAARWVSCFKYVE